MLDSDTKRRIDTARDILVGKVPDPKSQVEQITIALIYKFMDDMDAESELLGGQRKFFAGEFARYGWTKLMRSELGGHETLNLYAEAIDRMPENPGIPQLFRSIFNNAYLPYRDPETLRAFLKVIDQFEYDHSERLGDAFEYLLSVLGSQGDAGQFRTPRHIIEFMVDIVDPKKNETVLDPACGTGGFLISAYRHILEANQDEQGNSTLTPDERGALVGNFTGYDISPDMVRLSLVNMYLHGFPSPNVVEYDTLTSDERWNEHADVILANPPFMSPKGGIRPHKRFGVQSKRSEVLFVDYIAEHLTPNGRAGIIVPEGIIFQSQTAYVQLRKMLVEDYLVAVISLPAGVFNPYSGVKTSILILDKSLAKRAESIAFFNITSDGFGLGAQRRPIDKNDLPQVEADIAEYLRRLRASESLEDSHMTFGLVVPKEKLSRDSTYNLSGERHREVRLHSAAFPLVELGELCDLVRGVVYSKEDEVTEGGVKVLRANNIDRQRYELIVDNVKLVAPKTEFSNAKRLRKGDIFICLASGSKDHIGKVALINEDTDYYFGGFMGAIRVKPVRLLSAYLFKQLTTGHFNDFLREQIAGANINNLSGGILYRFQIPLPALDVQQEIAAEVEGYQKIIDGARAVVNNYRPHIPIDPHWPIDELGNVIESKPKNGYSGKPVPYQTNLKVLTLSATTSGHMDLTKFKYLDEHIPDGAECRCRRGDIYLQRGNTKELVGTSAMFESDDEGLVYPDLMIRVRAEKSKMDPHFLLLALQSKEARNFMSRNASGSAGSMPKINQRIVEQIPIPVPPPNVQQTIVANVEAEKALVDANRDLICRFEKKIEVALARVWGESRSKSEGAI